MNKKKYLTFDAIRFGFRMLRKHSYFLFKLSLVTGLLLWGITALICIIQDKSITHDHLKELFDTLGNLQEFSRILKYLQSGSLLRVIIASMIVIIIGISDMIATKTAVMLYDNQPISFKEIFTCWRKIPTYLGFPFLLLFISNIASHYFMGCNFVIEALGKLYKFFLIDKNTSINQALIGSWNISKGHILDMCMVWAIMGSFIVVLSMLSALVCFLIASKIITFIIACYAMSTFLFTNACVYAFFYRKLLEEKQMQLTPANIINEDYNQIPKPTQQTLQQ